MNAIHRAIAIFVMTFIVSYMLQVAVFAGVDGMVDAQMWADQAHYFSEDDERQFNYLAGYAYPGGTVIEATLLVQKLTGASFLESLYGAIFSLVALVIALSACVADRLRAHRLVWLGVVGILAPNWMFMLASPPTALAAVLLVLVMLLSLLVLRSEHGAVRIGWGVVLGALVATRADIGGLAAVMFFPLLYMHLGWRRSALAALTALVTFVVLDPYMWFMPLQHLLDIVFKCAYHYAVYSPSPLGFQSVLALSFLAVVAMVIATIELVVGKVSLVVPHRVLVAMCIGTVVATGLILTSHLQSIRYFIPLIFMWEALLPLLLLPFVEQMEFSFIKGKAALLRARTIASGMLILVLSLATGFWMISDLLMLTRT